MYNYFLTVLYTNIDKKSPYTENGEMLPTIDIMPIWTEFKILFRGDKVMSGTMENLL